MITLDYQTNNARWGWSGICFEDWESYSVVLGYLSNPQHNRELNPRSEYADISMRIEQNDRQGAWDKEGRIHYYGDLDELMHCLPDLYNHKSAGNGSVTARINSNEYIISLIEDYDFILSPRRGQTTADVFPADYITVKSYLENYLAEAGVDDTYIEDCLNKFDDGYNM